MLYKASAAGSLMLFGEHAVLHGGTAIVSATKKRIEVELTARADNEIHIESALGEFATSCSDFSITAPFEFILTAIKDHLSQLNSGFDLKVTSEFAADLGFGSSAAVTVATLKVLRQFLYNTEGEKLQLFNQARDIIRAVQGMGSGADVAASLFEDTVAYCAEPLSIEPLQTDVPLVAVYSGKKVKTTEVIAKVEKLQQQYPEQVVQIYDAINHCSNLARYPMQKQNWRRVGELMNIHHDLQVGLGVSTPILDELVAELRKAPAIYGAKISGSGLGDCVIGLGEIPENYFPQNSEQREIGVKQVGL